MESVLPRGDVTFEADTLGGVPGLWVHPAIGGQARRSSNLHAGWFNFGSAKAYRHLVGHIAARAGERAFIPDYRLAPKYPFPCASSTFLFHQGGGALADLLELHFKATKVLRA